MPLNEAHRVPRNIKIYDIAALLKIDALGQHVRGYENVVEIVVTSRRRFRRNRREAVNCVLP